MYFFVVVAQFQLASGYSNQQRYSSGQKYHEPVQCTDGGQPQECSQGLDHACALACDYVT